MHREETTRPSEKSGAIRPAFTASSAHRRVRPARPLASKVLLWGGLLLAALVLYFQLRPAAVTPASSPTPTATATPAPPPAATPAPATTELAGDWVEVVPEPAATATPTPWPTLPPRARRHPTPTPPVEQCVEAVWDAVQSFRPLNRVLVTIEATNGCGRELGPTEVWFQVSGWRQGAMVQTVDGHPMEELWPGHSEEVIIGLPGSIDWYDEIRVIVHGPGR